MVLRSYWSGGAPRGRAVTRFPGTRQEEEKQNKPERSCNSVRTPLKREPYCVQHGNLHEARRMGGGP